jgi:hypothetical protein
MSGSAAGSLGQSSYSLDRKNLFSTIHEAETNTRKNLGTRYPKSYATALRFSVSGIERQNRLWNHHLTIHPFHSINPHRQSNTSHPEARSCRHLLDRDLGHRSPELLVPINLSLSPKVQNFFPLARHVHLHSKPYC